MRNPLDYKRNENDYYPTPSWVTKILLPYLPGRIWGERIWEPAAGKDHIVNELRDDHLDVIGTDIDTGTDFLEQKKMLDGSRHIITNPPYTLAYEFAEHAINLTKETEGIVCLLLNNQWDTGKKNSSLTTLRCFSQKIVITKRIRWIEGTTGSPRENYAWYVWNYQNFNPPTISYWRG